MDPDPGWKVENPGVPGGSPEKMALKRAKSGAAGKKWVPLKAGLFKLSKNTTFGLIRCRLEELEAKEYWKVMAKAYRLC